MNINPHQHIIYVSAQLKEIQTVFRGLQTLYESYIPKADPVLVNDLLARLYENPNTAPFYMVEIFTKSGTDSEALRQRIWNTTGMMPAIYDNGTHYVINQRLTLEKLKEISDSEDVIEVTGDYTGTLTGLGASHDTRRDDNTAAANYRTSQQAAVIEKETKASGSASLSSVQAKQYQKPCKEYVDDKKKKSKITPYKPLIYVTIGVALALAIGGFILSGGMPPNINQNIAPQIQTTTSSSADPPGALHGYVGGPAGLPAVGASVIAANQETGYTENAIISINGQYFLGNLPPGEYIVMVAYPDGTNKAVNAYEVGSGSNHELNFSY